MGVLFIDSNSELDYTIQEKLKLEYISMPYTIKGKEYYYDLGKNTNFPEFFNEMRGGAVAKTSALNAQDYIKYFEPFLEKGEDILYITFSHKLSATFEQMKVAIEELKQKYPKNTIRYYDSKFISIGTASIVYRAAKMYSEGKTLNEIYLQLDHFRQHNFCAFTVDDLIYLYRGGRISKGKAVMGKLFNIKPILGFTQDGSLYNYAKANGRKKSIAMLAGYLNEYKVDTNYPISIVHADNAKDAQILKSLVEEKYPGVEIWEQYVGPVIGSHCGPDTIGIGFATKEPVVKE